MKAYPALHIEGGLFSADIPEQLLNGDLPGQRPQDFGLSGRQSLMNEAAATFADAQEYWRLFQHRLQRLQETDVGTSLTREAWISHLLGLLGYELHYNPSAYQADGQSFHISHRAGEHEDAPPVHIVGYRQELDRRGGQRMAPHSLMQEFLNRSEHLWGIVTNGRELRVLRDSTYVRKQAYVAFDLVQMMEERRFEDFLLMYRLLHRSRLPQATADAPRCLLEQYYQHSLQQGGRVRDRLREGVEQCLKRLGTGLLKRTPKECLPQVPEELYQQLLRLVYRLLFLLVSEERGLMGSNPLYLEHYSISRLRRLVDNPAAYTEHEDLWRSLQALWLVLRKQELAQLLALPPLNGELFSPMAVDDGTVSNCDLLNAMKHLVYYQERDSAPLRRVNYAALDTEELGSVYESLLESQPVINWVQKEFELVAGSERKSTGSYYTPPELVAELVKSALEPVIEEKLREAKQIASRSHYPDARSADFSPLEQAILSIKVIDPACGSGHFLLAAARRLGRELARVRTGDEEPSPTHLRRAIRDVVAHCIYGVDKNPLAVELCRVALWLESHAEGLPLTFLDHRIRCGDSLVGVLDIQTLHQGIPDGAFERATDDDATVCRDLKRRNRQQREGQMELFHAQADSALQLLSEQARTLDNIPDDTPDNIQRKSETFRRMCAHPDRQRQQDACDLWTAAFFQTRIKRNRQSGIDDGFITTEAVWRHMGNQPVSPQLLAHARSLAQQVRFFHWQLEFPEVFAQGGFDVVLGNPPWEQIQLEKKEFFSTRDAGIAVASNAADRQRMIGRLQQDNPALWHEYRRTLHLAESTSRFLRRSGEYPLTGRGRINTYSVFAERMCRLLAPRGRAGIIVPTGIATDDTNKLFFAHLLDEGKLVSLYDFENREGIFPGVHRSYKFCLLTLRGGRQTGSPAPTFRFFATRPEHLHDPRRAFSLGAEHIARINPNTRTLPLFRTRQDADLTRAIYERVPVLVNEQSGHNPWRVSFKQGLFNMSSHLYLFCTRPQLEAQGYRLVGNLFVKGETCYLPLYEAKMIWHYDHRFGTFEGVTDRSSTHLPTPDDSQHTDPRYVVQPWYWVSAREVQERLGEWQRGWLLGFRDVTNASNDRTAVFSVLPRVGVGNNLPLALFAEGNSVLVCSVIASLATIAFDYVSRQKIAALHMNFFFVSQLPILPPSSYTRQHLLFIVPRVLELVYTAWDVKPFFDDVWREADDTLRSAIRAQWEASHHATGGVDPSPPEWLPLMGIEPEGLPPFKWDESRRALLRAELDALYARLYGLTRKQLRYILDPADLTEKEIEDIMDPWEEVAAPLDPQGYAERCARSDFPGETFRVLKERELRELGEYRTRRLVLEAWERIGDESSVSHSIS